MALENKEGNFQSLNNQIVLRFFLLSAYLSLRTLKMNALSMHCERKGPVFLPRSRTTCDVVFFLLFSPFP